MYQRNKVTALRCALLNETRNEEAYLSRDKYSFFLMNERDTNDAAPSEEMLSSFNTSFQQSSQAGLAGRKISELRIEHDSGDDEEDGSSYFEINASSKNGDDYENKQDCSLILSVSHNQLSCDSQQNVLSKASSIAQPNHYLQLQ